MLRRDYLAVVTAAGTAGIATLKMQSAQGPGLEIQVIVAGAEPISVATGTVLTAGDQLTDMMRVVVVDQRAGKFNGTTRHYNMMSEPFSWNEDEDIPNYYSQTMSAGDPWTWEQIVADLESCPVMPAYPAWVPNNFAWDQVPLARVIDDFLSSLYWVVGWDITTNVWTCNTPGTMNTANAAMYVTAQKFHIAAGVGERNFNRAPGVFRVSFRTSNADDPGNPYSNSGGVTRSYTKDITVGPNTAIQQPLACGEVMAIWQDGAWANSAGMDAVAADLAPRAYAAMTVTPSQWEFAGIWPFSPDGAIRGIMWISDSQGARTIIRLNNDRDFMPLDDIRRVMETWSNQLIIGLGVSNVAFDAGRGVRQVWGGVSGSPRLASLSMSSGANATTPTGNATYKYDVTDFLTSNVVAEDVAPDANWRPMGILTGPGSLGYYIIKGGTFYLLNTNERANLVDCS